ncbi:MAG: hypothetical protein Q9M48_08070 [Rhodobacterales bacterium]|nr:hypothetical protein [Rhodobacterales bacterium]
MPQSAPSRERKTKSERTISARGLIEVLAGQVETLHDLAIQIEGAMSSALCTCNPLPNETLRTLQRVDYMRQSLKDIETILMNSSTHLDWHEDSFVTHEVLRESVLMEGSLEGIGPQGYEADKTSPKQQIDEQDDLWL